MGRLGYGVATKQGLVNIAELVCDVLGRGANGTAKQLLIETAQQETHLGSFRDFKPYEHGVGLCQFDPIGFKDVMERTRRHTKEIIKTEFALNLDKVQHRDLAYSPFLSLLFCRLFYRLRKEEIPFDLSGRGSYWKRHYNTMKGAGTWSEYVQNANKIEVAY
ncbi:MAG: hypothetical protein GY818_02250 [Planctomycetaceae bacterium]|nr:hypothetical protein [Planctomycetaceae bacterium]